MDWCDEEGENKSKQIEKIDIEFDSGEKISIFADSSDPYHEERDPPVSLCLRLVQYKGKEVNWRHQKAT